MDTQRLVLFVVFSFTLLLLWDAWQKQYAPAPPVPQTTVPAPSIGQAPVPGAKLGASAPVAAPAGETLQKGARIKVKTDLLMAEIDTFGGDIRHLELLKHRDAENQQKNFVLFDDAPSDIYIAQSGLIGVGLPNHKALFQATPGTYDLKPGEKELKITLDWQGDNGVKVSKIFTFHAGSYLVDVSYLVQNGTNAKVDLFAYYQFLHHGKEAALNPFMVQTFVGPSVYTEKLKFQKESFSDIEKGKEVFPKYSNDGWIAMLQHYFLSAWLPKNGSQREFYAKRLSDGLYTAGVILPGGVIQPGASQTISVPLYAGPQEQDKLKPLAPGLDLTVDYGWLTIIAAPLFWVLALIYKGVGNWGVAIILLTVLIKLVFYPLSAKSYHSMAQMKLLAPKLQKLKEQFGDDRQRLHQAMMELYKTEKINPLGGCLPVVVQIPVFISLYWVLLASVELRHAPFMLWIQDLSTPDPFYVLPIIMGLTMIIQTRLNPTPPDPIQAKVMMIMPVAFSVFFFFFPAGLVLYWLVNNILSIAQQWHITRTLEGAKGGNGKR